MSDSSAIQWTDATWNPVTGCTRVSPGCAHCYIERTPPFRMEDRVFARVGNAETTGVRLHPDRLEQPLRWRNPRRVFVCSVADLFHDEIPYEYVRAVFNTMRCCDGGIVAATGKREPSHIFQVLTKRPERALELWQERKLGFIDWPPHIWLGVSIENARYTWRADVLREIRAPVRFISAEPLLGSLLEGRQPRLRGWIGSANWGEYDADSNVFDPKAICLNCGRDWGGHAGTGCFRPDRAPIDLTGIDWLIVGGESGPGARPFRLEHARELIDACFRAGTGRPAIFVKQLGRDPVDRNVLGGEVRLDLADAKGGDPDEWPPDLRIREFPDAARGAAAA